MSTKTKMCNQAIETILVIKMMTMKLDWFVKQALAALKRTKYDPDNDETTDAIEEGIRSAIRGLLDLSIAKDIEGLSDDWVNKREYRLMRTWIRIQAGLILEDAIGLYQKLKSA